MQRLWAGWRMSYIESARNGGEECLFCAKARAGSGPSAGSGSGAGAGSGMGANEKELVLERGRACFTMLNAFPYNTGHLMVAPYRHLDSFAALSTEERVDLIRLLGRAEDALRREYRPHGFNMGVNLGAAAGAGVVGHLHAHLVPRWTGDTNFMGTVGETKVLPETLERTFARLHRALAAAGAPAGAVNPVAPEDPANPRNPSDPATPADPATAADSAPADPTDWGPGAAP